jgi:hypothetical protein
LAILVRAYVTDLLCDGEPFDVTITSDGGKSPGLASARPGFPE